jgi:ADP-ribosylglycohydrolase
MSVDAITTPGDLETEDVDAIVAGIEQTLQKDNAPTSVADPLLSVDELINKIMGLIVGCAAGEAYSKKLNSAVNNTAKDAPNDTVEWGYSTNQLILIMRTIQKSGKMHVPTFLKMLADYEKTGLTEYGHNYVDEYTKKVLHENKTTDDPARASVNVYKKYDEKNEAYISGADDTCTGTFKRMSTADNTPLIRSVLVGLFDDWDTYAFAACMPTHADHRCISASVMIAGAVRSMVSGRKSDISEIVTHTASMVMSTEKMKNIRDINEFVRFTSEGYCTDLKCLALGKGYTNFAYKCMSQSMYCLGEIADATHAKKDVPVFFKTCLFTIANAGGDSDANCALSGAIMGCEVGLENIPEELINMINPAHYKKLIAEVMQFLKVLGLIYKQEVDNKQEVKTDFDNA